MFDNHWTQEKVTKEFLEEVYDILIKHGGARSYIINDNGKEIDTEKFSFVHSHMDKKYPCTEYRFSGVLGFGGKFRIHKNRVDCYSEDRTPEREVIIETINTKLEELYNNHNSL